MRKRQQLPLVQTEMDIIMRETQCGMAHRVSGRVSRGFDSSQSTLLWDTARQHPLEAGRQQFREARDVVVADDTMVLTSLLSETGRW